VRTDGQYHNDVKCHFLVVFLLSPHPYIFFNDDGVSITFVGFTVTEQGNLINPENDEIIERGIMPRSLYVGLKRNRVNFSDDHRKWKKKDMIHKISMVMGVHDPSDPDKSYVLTVDNVMKILAIQMRFRWVYSFDQKVLQ
jgi:hypothetical protein